MADKTARRWLLSLIVVVALHVAATIRVHNRDMRQINHNFSQVESLFETVARRLREQDARIEMAELPWQSVPRRQQAEPGAVCF